MTVQEVLDIYTADDLYVENSMVNKSYDDTGCVFVFLWHNRGNTAYRRELFIATTGTGDLEDRTATNYVEINEAR